MAWYWGCLFTTLLVVFSYPPYSLGLLLLVGLVPCQIAVERAKSARGAFLRTWLVCFVATCISCPWLAYAMHEFGGLSWAISYPCVVLLAMVEQLSWPIMAYLRYTLHHRWQIRPVLWSPAAILVLDRFWPKIFPDTLGASLYSVPILAQVSDIAGVWGLTALLSASNEMLTEWYLKIWPREVRIRHTIVVGILMIGTLAYGIFRYLQIQEIIAHPKGQVRVAIVQPNINSMAKVRAEFNKGAARADVLSRLSSTTEKAVAEKPQLIVWPETAFPNAYHSGSEMESAEVSALLDQNLKKWNIPLLFGGTDYDSDYKYNAIYLSDPRRDPIHIQRYHKNILLAFGETMPFASTFPSVRDWFRVPNAARYGAGEGPAVFELDQIRYGPMICLEGLYSEYVRSIARQKVDILVNVTNDSWYGPGNEPEQHLYLTSFRSIETRRPMIRATNTGISAYVDIDGSVMPLSQRDREEVLTHSVPVYGDVASIYVNFPLWIQATALLWAALPFLRMLLKRILR